MEQIRKLRSRVVTAGLGAAEAPWRMAARLVPGGDRQQKAANAIEGAAATARQVVGSLTGDHELVADGKRRRIALDERMHAAALRGQAAAQHQAAEEAADQERAAIEGLREERLEAHEEAAERRELKVAEQTTARADAAETRAKRARLKAVEAEAKALDERSEALTEDDEARRLAEAAAKTKAARKQRATG
jgi:hypothetical protein